MNKMDGLASNLRTARRRAGMTQAELASAAGVGTGTEVRWKIRGFRLSANSRTPSTSGSST
jgi:transcriptional regulator with XRE-family HTH domain